MALMMMVLRLVLALSTLISITGASDVVRSVGDSLQLDIQRPVPNFDSYWEEFIWEFNRTNTVVKYYNEFNKTKHYAGYKGRVEFNGGTYSLTLKNLQRTDSGLYEARAFGLQFTVLAVYRLSVLDPVEAPVLTQLNNDTCNITLTCKGHDLFINSSCYNDTCEEKEVTSPGGVTLSLSVRGSSIICNHSNPVSWKEDVLEMGELKRSCTDGDSTSCVNELVKLFYPCAHHPLVFSPDSNRTPRGQHLYNPNTASASVSTLETLSVEEREGGLSGTSSFTVNEHQHKAYV
ncbi:hypothetical protein NFI96_008591 [Prochilodus magdalenae]|nr:hypothetical protein NFI96_008591 [Prochilodus magdalenae]